MEGIPAMIEDMNEDGMHRDLERKSKHNDEWKNFDKVMFKVFNINTNRRLKR